MDTKSTAANERFGATEAGSADLKGSAGKPPLRQAATTLGANGRQRGEKRTKNKRKFFYLL